MVSTPPSNSASARPWFPARATAPESAGRGLSPAGHHPQRRSHGARRPADRTTISRAVFACRALPSSPAVHPRGRFRPEPSLAESGSSPPSVRSDTVAVKGFGPFSHRLDPAPVTGVLTHRDRCPPLEQGMQGRVEFAEDHLPRDGSIASTCAANTSTLCPVEGRDHDRR